MGAGFGALIRHAFTLAFNAAFPWGTLLVNVTGSLLMGVVLAILSRYETAEPFRLFLAVGLLGGFTTFSTFSADFLKLAQAGVWTHALGYAFGTNFAAIAGCAFGWWLTSRLLG